MSVIAVMGTLDTKGVEHFFVAERIKERGHKVIIIDVGTLGEPMVEPDITREQVAKAGEVDLAEIGRKKDRGASVTAMSKAAPVLLSNLVASGKIEGVISLGGGGGTAIATAAMRELPVGFPKVMVSTLASGNTAQYIGVKDIVMFPAIVDISGINRISRQILTRAAGAICGMVEAKVIPAEDKPIIVASMFGNTTSCVQHAQRVLEEDGFEVLVFHATGMGGRSMESLIEAGMVAGVLDVTTTEWADEIVGGFLGAGPTRLEAAAKTGVPAVIAPGCLDMVNFYGADTVPSKFKDRKFYQHNPQVTLMRTTPDECAKIGSKLAEKVNLSKGPVTVLIPAKAISVISAPGRPFCDAAADKTLFESLKSNLRKDIPVIEMDCEINDPVFAQACASALLANIRRGR